MIKIKVEGIEEINQMIRQLSSDRDKKREIQNIYSKQLLPIKRELKAEAPQAKRDVKYHRKDGVIFKPGNLGRSIKIFRGRGAENLAVFVGARAKGKPEGSGYYSWFVQKGTRRNDGRGITRKNDYVARVYERNKDTLHTKAGSETITYIEKRARQLGFK